MSRFLAIAFLLSLPLLGALLYRGRIAGMFCPRSRVVSLALGLVILLQVVTSAGTLLFGGRWEDAFLWSGALFCLYTWARGMYLLLQASDAYHCGSEETAGRE